MYIEEGMAFPHLFTFWRGRGDDAAVSLDDYGLWGKNTLLSKFKANICFGGIIFASVSQNNTRAQTVVSSNYSLLFF